ncbi:MAG TPA: hypothetical protein VKB27_08730 [Gammaproteobacteria bacterium]|nr:hypothetical protein [Gammaproteobacteria bacterium]
MKPDSVEGYRAHSDRKDSDRSFILTLVGALLLTPPLASIFQLDIRLLGIPFTGLYLFVVWGGLVAGTALLSRRLRQGVYWDNAEDEQGGETGDKAE